MGVVGSKINYDDYRLLPDDGKRHEVLEGELFVTPSPQRKHQQAVRRMLVMLNEYLKHSNLGEVYVAPFDVVLTPEDIVQPDLLVLLKKGAAVLNDAGVWGPPDIVLEVLSPGTRKRDEQTKRKRYGQAGVREYWLIDPENETIRVFRQAGSTFGAPETVGKEVTSPLLPGFRMPLKSVFED